MEDKNICRLAKKIDVNTDVYILKTIGYLDAAEFDENNNLIYEHDGKTEIIPYCTEESFLKSEAKVCYSNHAKLSDLKQTFDIEDDEECFQAYVKESESLTEIIYYSKEAKDYDSLLFNSKDLDDFFEFLKLLDASAVYDTDQSSMIGFYKGKVLIGIDLYQRMSKLIRSEDLESLTPILQQIDFYCDIEAASGEKQTATSGSETGAALIVYEKQNKLTDKSLKEITEEFNSLIGLENIKIELDKLTKFLSFVDKSKDCLQLEKPNLNMIFTGNPGTGKTTVAKYLSALLFKLGFANEKIFECTAKDFIAEFVGQTAIKAHQLLNKAKGGIVFIDEAYSFVSQGNSFAQEALTEILKEMEKNNTIFIFSGYKKEMEHFVKYNSGLTSRIGYYFDFKDYNTIELFSIFERKLKTSKMELAEECKSKIIDIIDMAHQKENFGNGRFIDKLFNAIIIEHAYNTNETNDISELIKIVPKDIPDNILQQILYTNTSEKKILGFTK